MPGPGGGGNSGGGGRGGGFSGGGGGFHGGHIYHGSGYRTHTPGNNASQGGSAGLPMGRGLVIFFITLFVGAILAVILALLSSAFGWKMPTDYDEDVFRAYADEQYALHFSNSEAYEDNLLLIVLTKPNHKDFYYIAWVGDHIHPNISPMLGNNNTPLGRSMNANINPNNYRPSLDSDLANVMAELTDLISGVDTESSFSSSDTRKPVGRFVNNTKLPMDDSIMESALQEFADYTGIPVTLVVEDAQNVFSPQQRNLGWIVIVGSVAVIVIIAAVFYFFVKRRKVKHRT